ncbi:MAG: hypothetical protein AAFX99_27745, partial [Myxococcota bacterium]
MTWLALAVVLIGLVPTGLKAQETSPQDDTSSPPPQDTPQQQPSGLASSSEMAVLSELNMKGDGTDAS